jgi:class 3 adenylate cyclase
MEGSAIVKTMGFGHGNIPYPIVACAVGNATKIANMVNHALAKVGFRTPYRLALNDCLDYFGSTVNIAALPAFSQGGELVFTEEFNDDSEVQQFLAENTKLGALRPFTGNIKGFDEPFMMWKLKV